MHKFDKLMKVSDAYTHNILNKNSIGTIIENEPAMFINNVPKSRIYHAITRDLVVNELFRRVESQGRTMD